MKKIFAYICIGFYSLVSVCEAASISRDRGETPLLEGMTPFEVRVYIGDVSEEERQMTEVLLEHVHHTILNLTDLEALWESNISLEKKKKKTKKQTWDIAADTKKMALPLYRSYKKIYETCQSFLNEGNIENLYSYIKYTLKNFQYSSRLGNRYFKARLKKMENYIGTIVDPLLKKVWELTYVGINRKTNKKAINTRVLPLLDFNNDWLAQGDTFKEVERLYNAQRNRQIDLINHFNTQLPSSKRLEYLPLVEDVRSDIVKTDEQMTALTKDLDEIQGILPKFYNLLSKNPALKIDFIPPLDLNELVIEDDGVDSHSTDINSMQKCIKENVSLHRLHKSALPILTRIKEQIEEIRRATFPIEVKIDDIEKLMIPSASKPKQKNKEKKQQPLQKDPFAQLQQEERRIERLFANSSASSASTSSSSSSSISREATSEENQEEDIKGLLEIETPIPQVILEDVNKIRAKRAQQKVHIRLLNERKIRQAQIEKNARIALASLLQNVPNEKFTILQENLDDNELLQTFLNAPYKEFSYARDFERLMHSLGGWINRSTGSSHFKVWFTNSINASYAEPHKGKEYLSRQSKKEILLAMERAGIIRIN